MATIQAKFAGRCRRCGAPYSVGAALAKCNRNGWVHPSCVDTNAAAAPARRAPVRRSSSYSVARRNYEATGDYYGSGLYDEES